MRIKRVSPDIRIAPGHAVPFFATNLDLWGKLKAGEEITIPDGEYEVIKSRFGKSIMEVPEEKPKVSLRKVDEGKKDKEDE